MKKQVLLFGASLLSIISSAQIQNGDLENWSDTLISDNVDDWSKTGTVTKSTDAQHLATSIKLETTVDSYGDTNRALIHWGVVGQKSALTGLIGKPDSLIYWTKHNLQPTDTALSLIVPNDFFGMSFIEFSGVQNTWKRRAVAIDSTTDSLQIMFNTGHILDGTPGLPGSWIMLDNIQIKTTTGGTFIPTNNSFENWTTITVEMPNNWETTDLFYASLGITDTTVFKTTDSYANTYAAELKTISSAYGPLGGEIFANYTSAAKPTSLDLYYKFSPLGADTAFVEVYFYSAGTEVGSGDYEIINDIRSYPENTDIEVEYVYSKSSVLNGGNRDVTDGRNVSLKVSPNALSVCFNNIVG